MLGPSYHSQQSMPAMDFQINLPFFQKRDFLLIVEIAWDYAVLFRGKTVISGRIDTVSQFRSRTLAIGRQF